jgi:hypothetical protein
LFLFIFSSCGGEKEKSETTEIKTDTVAQTQPVAISTISTFPQPMVVVRHKVADFAKWQSSYDAHDSMRLANGIHNYVIGRSLADSNMILVALKADDLVKARAFTKDPSLKTAMQKGGVTGPANILFMTAIYQDSAIIPSSIRSMNIMTVKDREAWYSSFKEGKQERLDNGIVERVVSQDGNDIKKVVLVTALTDTAKAFAYYKSDALKKRWEASGVVGQPERFLFRVVKRY